MFLPWHAYLMALIYVIAGVNHFRNPKVYLKIIPPSFPNPRILNIAAGLFEVLLGMLLCVPVVSPYAAWGIVVMLMAVFPANIYMYRNPKARLGISKPMLLLRLPLQIVLIIWAYHYTT